jgi:gliding motility-associated-like protein
MWKIYAIAFLAMFLGFGHHTAFAQGASDSTSFILTSRKVCVGDTIDIPVRTVHFKRVAGFQFAVSWAKGQFRFLNILNNVFPNTEFDFEAPVTGTRVNVAWFKADGTFSSLPDTTQIFIIRLIAQQPGNPTTLGFVTNPRDQTAPVVAQFNQAGNDIREFTPPLIGNSIRVLAVPTVTAPTDTITCRDPYVFLNAKASDSTSTYAWSGPNGFTSTLARDTAFIPGRYQVIATTDICVSKPLDVVIGFDQTKPTAPTISADSINCLLRQSQLRFSPVDNTLNYFWVTPKNDTLPDPISRVKTPGMYQLLVIQPRNGCQSSAQVKINADTILPSIRLAGLGRLNCVTNSVQLNARSNLRNLAFTWRNSTGAIVSQDSFLKISTPGAYQITVRNLKSACTTIRDTNIVADLAVPTANLGTPNTITCTNATAILSATLGTPRARGYWLSATLSDTLSRTIATKVGKGGLYNFIALDTVNGCRLRLSTSVIADTLRPIGVIRVVTPFSCANPTAQLAVDVAPGILHTWSGNGISGNANTVQVDTPGLYRILLENQVNGCTSRDSLRLGGNTDGPKFVRLNVKQPPCAPDSKGSIGIEGVSGGVGPYTFSLEGGTFSSKRNYPDLVPGKYQLKIQDAAGCEGDTSLTINSSIPIEVKINALSNEINPGDSLLLTAQLGDSSNLASISWQGTGLAPCKGCMNIQVNPSKSTVYQALVESTNGCKSQAEFQVFVVQENQVYAPTAFSPNGDNKNDRFFLAGKKNLKVTYFRIFDRWGTLVFEATNGALNDASIGWDGTYAGKVVPPGAFVWIAELELNSKTLQSYSGEAILLK